MTDSKVESKDFSRIFSSVEELEKGEDGIVEGNIPTWINGTYFRNGSAKFDIGDKFTLNHYLDGYTMLSSFEIENGRKITFRKKYLQSDAYRKAMVAKKNIFSEFGTKGSVDRTKNIFNRIVSTLLPLEFSDNCTTAIVQIGRELFCTTDACFMRRFDRHLETHDKYDIHDYFGLSGATAHLLRDKDGTYYNIAMTVKSGLKYCVLKIPSSEKTGRQTYEEMMENAKILASIPSRWSTSISCNHSFGLTDRFIILIDQPFVTSLARITSMMLKGGGPTKNLLEWRGGKEGETTRFILVDKKTGQISDPIYFSAEPFFFLHVINSFDQENEVILDIITYKSPAFLEKLYLKDLRRNIVEIDDLPTAQRFHLPLVDLDQIKDGANLLNPKGSSSAKAIKIGNVITVTPDNLTLGGIDGPQINKKYQGRKYKFFYGAGMLNENDFTNCVAKINVETKERIVWKYSKESYPMEPVFIPTPPQFKREVNGEEEDDGLIMTTVVDLRDHKDFIVFLDAKTMKEVGRAKFKSQIPMAAHSLFLESHELI